MSRASSILEISVAGNELLVSCQREHDQNPIARFRWREIMRAMTITLRRLGPVVDQPERCAVRVTVSPYAAARRVNDILTSLLSQITRILQQPCTPKMVNELLRIQTKERLRWTRDGRLKHFGRLGARNGNGGACRTYAADDIVELIKRPEIIEQWRRFDSEQGAH
jgi:hypothetical protein